MMFRVRTGACTAILLFLSVVSLSAANTPLRVVVQPTSDRVQAIRYQTGVWPDSLWTERGVFPTPISLEGFDSSQQALFVQQTVDGTNWGKTYAYRYDAKTHTWEISLAVHKPLNIQVKPVSKTVKAFRYQTGPTPSGSWTEVDSSHSVLALDSFDSTQDTLFIQQSEDLLTWGNTYTYRYDFPTDVWSLTHTEPHEKKAVDSLELKLYGLYPASKSSTYYASVLGTGLKLNIALNEHDKLIGYGEVAYSRGPSKSDWTEAMQAANISVGLGYRFGLSEKLHLVPELGYGVVVHLINADFDEDGTKTLETFFDQQLRLSLNLTYAFNDTYTLLVAPLGVLFFEKNSMGTLFGVQTALRYTF
ncbi:MAG: hypothetical protein PHO72_04235 [Sphaerochaeta sp.]|nr:hypothetical protein [Sphaerochaeta sp.]